jgi:hypothetical protein
MSRHSPEVSVEELGGDRYTDLGMVQRLVFDSLAGDLSVVLRVLLDAGILIVVDGCVVPDPERFDCNE